jgi:hypothetical protein
VVRQVPRGRKQTHKCKRIQLNRQKAEIFNKVLANVYIREGRKALVQNFCYVKCIVISALMPH